MNQFEDFVTGQANDPEGISIDPVNRVLYWNNYDGGVWKKNLNGTGEAEIIPGVITGNELKHPEYSSTFRNIEAENIEIKPGLGLLENVIIDQHFVKRSRHNRLISAIIEYPDVKGIGIDESTAILVVGNTAEVVGESQVIILENPKKYRIIRNGRLGATGLQMTILLPGDKFKL